MLAVSSALIFAASTPPEGEVSRTTVHCPHTAQTWIRLNLRYANVPVPEMMECVCLCASPHGGEIDNLNYESLSASPQGHIRTQASG